MGQELTPHRYWGYALCFALLYSISTLCINVSEWHPFHRCFEDSFYDLSSVVLNAYCGSLPNSGTLSNGCLLYIDAADGVQPLYSDPSPQGVLLFSISNRSRPSYFRIFLSSEGLGILVSPTDCIVRAFIFFLHEIDIDID